MPQAALQFVVMAFDNDDHVRSQLEQELANAYHRNAFALVDALFLFQGNRIYPCRLPFELGVSEHGLMFTQALWASQHNQAVDAFGPVIAYVRGAAAALPNNGALLIVLFEGDWDDSLAEMLELLGAQILMHSFLDNDALTPTMYAAPYEEALFDPTHGEHDPGSHARDIANRSLISMVSAEVVRTLIAAGLIDDTEVEVALLALLDAGLVAPEIIGEALEHADDLPLMTAQVGGTEQQVARSATTSSRR